MTAAVDIDRTHDLVVVGSRWHGWGHHWTAVDERERWGMREVRLVRDVRGPKGMERGIVKRHAQHWEWVAAWRVQKYCRRTEAP